MRRGMASCLSLSLALCLLCAQACADTVYLSNGQTMNGEVVQEDDDKIVLAVPDGRITLRKSQIDSIERQTPLENKLDLALRFQRAQNFERGVKLLEELYVSEKKHAAVRQQLAAAYDRQGRYYQEHHRFIEARGAFENLLKLDPDRKELPHNAAEALRQIQALERNFDALAAQARGLAENNEWARAIAAFEEAIAYTPDARATIAPELARCLVKRALKLAREGRAPQAAADLETALKLDPSDRLESLYISCALQGVLSSLNRGSLPAAQAGIQRVLAIAPGSKPVLYVAGLVEQAAGRPPEAADAFARALGMRVDGATAEYMAELRAKLEKELGVAGNKLPLPALEPAPAEGSAYAVSAAGPQQKIETEHFVILHYNEMLAKDVAERAEQSRRRITAALGLKDWTGKARIYIHRTQGEYTARTAQPEWTGGFSKFSPGSNGRDSGVLEIHTWQMSPRILTSVLPHEIAHLAVNTNLADVMALPRCLHEGFAVLMEPQYRQDYFLAFLRRRLQSKDFIPLPELLASRDYPRDPEFFYAEGYALLEFLAQTPGDGKTPGGKDLERIVPLIKTPAKAAERILEISGEATLEDLEAKWKQWILERK